MFNIITIGSATRDVFLKSKDIQLVPSDKFSTGVGECVALGSKVEADYIHFDTGGGATNAAVTFSRFGFKTGLISRVGEDGHGDLILKVLKKEGIGTSLVQKTKTEHTAYSVLLMAQGGERTAIAYRGASAKIEKSKINWSKAKAEGYYVTSLGGDLSIYKEVVSRAKVGRVGWNPGGAELKQGLAALSPLIAKTAVFIVNREEAAELLKIQLKDTNALLKGLGELGAMFAIMTDGRDGAYGVAKEQMFHAGVLDVPVINTTGAGDAFGSALCAAMARGQFLPEALKVATLNSHGVIQKMGAKTGILKSFPSKREIDKVKFTKL